MADHRLLLVLLALAACKGQEDDTADTGLDLSDAPIRSCEVTLTHRPPPDVAAVAVAGSFNGWTPQALEDPDGDGVLERWLGELQPGTYAYKWVYDGVYQDPAPDVPTTWEDGFENQALVVGDCDLPDLEALSGSATPDGHLEAVFRFTRAADGAPLDPRTVEVTIGGLDLATTGAIVDPDPARGTLTITATDLPAGKHSVRVEAADTEGRLPEAGPGFLPLWVEPEPFTWESGVLYYVFTDRFADAGGTFPTIDGTEYDGANYLGGDLVGARQKLEEGWFDDLGVTSIWLSPVYENPDAAYVGIGGWHYAGYHGYWPVEPRVVEERLGTDTVTGDQALRDFVDAAHAHGIRVVLDLVLNHVHEDHPYVEEYGLGGEPCVCTTDPGPCNWDTNPLFCWFTDYLPDIDYRDQRLVDQMVSDVLWWTESYDVDGFRIDAAKHMDHVIMRTLSITLQERYEQAGGAPFWLVGETFVGQGGQGLIMDYVADYELGGQFDFPLLYPIRNGIGKEEGFTGLAAEVRAGDAAYGDFVHGMSPFMGNHDVERYATYVEGCDNWQLFGGCQDLLAEPGGPSGEQQALVDKLALSWAFVVTQPGVPLLYYGDEVGLAGAGDPDNRRLMPWTRTPSQQALLERVQDLSQVRRDVPALQTGERTELWVDGDLYVYGRYGSGLDGAVVVLHRGTGERSETVWVPTALDLEGRTLTDALGSGRTAAVTGGQMTLTVGPKQVLVLVPD